MLIRFFLLTFALSLATFGQGKDNRRHIRLLALGEMPTTRTKLVDNVRIAEPFLPGEVPPDPVAITTSKGGSVSFPLKLKTISGFASLETEVRNFQMWEGEAPKGAALLKGPAPRGKLSLAILYRDHARMTWLAPRIKVLKDDPKTFPRDHLRLVNVSDAIILIRPEGEKVFKLDPGESKIRRVRIGRSGRSQVFTIKAARKGQSEAQFESLHENTIAHEKGQRTNCFFYKSQSEPPAKTVLMTTVGEELPKLPKPPKKD